MAKNGYNKYIKHSIGENKMITENQYNEFKAKYETYHAARKVVCGNSNCVTPEQQKMLPESPKSEEISAVEVYEFITNPPTKYTSYVNLKEKTVTTWTGEILGKITGKQKYKNNMGANMQQIWFKGINGKNYYGFYPSDNQDCCNFKQVK